MFLLIFFYCTNTSNHLTFFEAIPRNFLKFMFDVEPKIRVESFSVVLITSDVNIIKQVAYKGQEFLPWIFLKGKV